MLGQTGGARTSFRGPVDVAAGTTGRIYVSDSGNNRIRKVSGGVITTVASAGLLLPYSVTADNT